MTTAQRIDHIEAFLHSQRYLHGLQFLIIEDGDGFIIEFVTASQRQLIALNRALVADGMLHIRSRAREVLKFDKPRFKKKHRKH